MVDIRGEKDIEQLRKIALVQGTQIDLLIKRLQAQALELGKLKDNPRELQETLALLSDLVAKKIAEEHAPQSEPNVEPAEPKPPKVKKPRTEHGPTPQPELPHVEEVFTLDDADATCTACGGKLAPMDGQFEESELVDVIEVSYRVVQVKQQKYVCRCGACLETAPGPARAIRGGRYSLGFAIKVVIDKYLDHIPLARQERILRRHGLVITTQTLWNQLLAIADRVRPAYRALWKRALDSPVIGVDQTGWMRLDDKTKKKWQMWCVTAPGIVVHKIRGDKGAKTFEALLTGFEGIIVCDAAQTHEAGARELGGIVLAGCWAHVFRKYEAAAKDHPEATLALKWIGDLYKVDDAAGDDLAALAELRRTKSKEVLDDFKTWLDAQATLRSTSIGNAIGYTLDNWERLNVFVKDVRVPLDNNATERGIRGPVVGRRNHFGSKTSLGTDVASIFYSLIETAKLVGVNPAAYLLEAARAHDRGEILLPQDFARTRE